ncbi:uncharacterized protein LOC120386011 isoform X2 [Mauremys reevesii]|uniref:uncharacterized protein LOC120386011 isoform X2 n=1 Tax=Mauremys reevesii TaxID=260615 RepID=UPI00193EDF16|nr:uncharacterized protein LOC120386011 isoform X2 [Mauremys reevesii]
MAPGPCLLPRVKNTECAIITPGARTMLERTLEDAIHGRYMGNPRWKETVRFGQRTWQRNIGIKFTQVKKEALPIATGQEHRVRHHHSGSKNYAGEDPGGCHPWARLSGLANVHGRGTLESSLHKLRRKPCLLPRVKNTECAIITPGARTMLERTLEDAIHGRYMGNPRWKETVRFGQRTWQRDIGIKFTQVKKEATQAVSYTDQKTRRYPRKTPQSEEQRRLTSSSGGGPPPENLYPETALRPATSEKAATRGAPSPPMTQDQDAGRCPAAPERDAPEGTTSSIQDTEATDHPAVQRKAAPRGTHSTAQDLNAACCPTRQRCRSQ